MSSRDYASFARSNMIQLYEALKQILMKNRLKFVNDFHLKEKIDENYQMLERRTMSEKSICAIFEKGQKKQKLIDRFTKEKISETWDHDFTYLLIKDGVDQSKYINNEISERINIISRPKSAWSLLEDSVFILSKNINVSFLNEIKTSNVFDPDLIVVVLNSKDELEDEDVQAFLLKVGKDYDQRNFILVLNDEQILENEECLICSQGSIRSFLKQTQIDLENRIFICPFSENVKKQNFEDDPHYSSEAELEEEIKKQLKIETILKKLNNKINEIFSIIYIIEKSFNIQKVEETIRNYNEMIQRNYLNIERGVTDFQKSSAEKIKRKDNETYDDLLRSLILTYMENQDIFREVFRVRERVTYKYEMEIVEKIAQDLFFNTYLNKEFMKNKIKELLDGRIGGLSSEETDIKKVYENFKANVADEVFGEFVNNIYEGVYAVVKDKLKLFKDQFCQRSEKIAENIKNEVDQLVMTCKDYKVLRQINDQIELFRLDLPKKSKRMKKDVKNYLDNINSTVLKFTLLDIYPNYLGVLILDSVGHIELNININHFITKINCILESNRGGYNTERYTVLRQEIEAVKQHSGNMRDRIVVFLGQLNDNRFYEEKVWSPKALWRIVGYKEPITKRFLNQPRIMIALQNLKTTLDTELDLFMKELHKISLFIKFN